MPEGEILLYPLAWVIKNFILTESVVVLVVGHTVVVLVVVLHALSEATAPGSCKNSLKPVAKLHTNSSNDYSRIFWNIVTQLYASFIYFVKEQM
jgi:hypothetical protein